MLVGSSGCGHCSPRSRRKDDATKAKLRDDPDEERFDYEAFLQAEFGHSVKPRGISWIWWVTAVLLLAAFLWGSLWWR